MHCSSQASFQVKQTWQKPYFHVMNWRTQTVPEHQGIRQSTGLVWPACLPKPSAFPGHLGTPKMDNTFPLINASMTLNWNMKKNSKPQSNLCVYSDGPDGRNLIEVTWINDQTLFCWNFMSGSHDGEMRWQRCTSNPKPQSKANGL